MKNFDLKRVRRVYMVGIKGSGMAGLAEIFQSMGKEVIGSDTQEKFFTDEILKRRKIKYFEGFSKDNIKKEEKPDLVVYSTAYSPENNEELKFAKKKKFAMASYPEAVGRLMQNKYAIAVCGTHGKTTTSAMLALALREGGLDPTAIIGSQVKQFESGILFGKSKYMVIEADEYQDKFSHYSPMGVILTSVDFDHPDYFEDFDAYKEAFKRFVRKIPKHGFLVVWGESAATVEVAKEANCRVIVYGLFRNICFNGVYSFVKEKKKYQDLEINERVMEQVKEEFAREGKTNVECFAMPVDLNLKVPGKHNLLNATASLAASLELGVSQEKAVKALNNYQGASRRFEFLGERNGAKVIDDYAHHPEEIRATLEAVKQKYPKKNIICVFHPHTFSRTKALLDEFSQSFDLADEVYILDIYGSAREAQGGVHSEDLVYKMKFFRDNVEYIAGMEEAYEKLRSNLGADDVVVTMGAGNVFELGKRLVEKSKN
ncbi:MAG: UDP-N-acetylmuramate--L-alanine ligase [Candidatus Moraniibacteriota bacterium]